MKEFQQPQIDGTRNLFKEKGFPVEERQVGNLVVSYFVLPQTLNPTLPDFALRMTRTNPGSKEVSGIFGVSDSVPEALRPYWAAHEIIEFTKIGITQEGRCTQAEEQVVALVPSPLRQAYVDRRVTFFTNLIKLFTSELEGNTGNYTQDDLKEAEASLRYLLQQQPQSSS